MKPKFISLFFVLFLFLSLCISFVKSEVACKCQTSVSAPQAIKDDPNYKLEEIVEGSTNWGKPFAEKEYYFLPVDATISSTRTGITSKCPKGFRLPTKAEAEKLLKSVTYDILTDPNGNYKCNISKHYYTDTYAEDYTFYAITFNKTTKTVSIIPSDASVTKTKNAGKCIFDSKLVNFNLEGINYDLLKGENITVTANSNLFKGYLWRFQKKTYTTQQITISPTRRGCFLLETWGKGIDNKNAYSCSVVYARQPFTMNGTSNFKLDYVTILPQNYTRTRMNHMFFSPSLAPIAPKAKGGYYLAYNDITAQKMTVVEYMINDTVLKTTQLEYDALPLDIIETDYGFGIYARYVNDSHHSFVVGYNFDYSKRFYTTIMNNGANATKFKEGIRFSDYYGCLEGIEVMYNPHNGKLSYGRGYLTLIFAHYNYFEYEGGHSGDTYFVFDETGKSENAQYAWTWSTSHSLIQSHIYDGKYFVTASLGDAYPMAIALSVIDVNQHTSFQDTTRGYCQVVSRTNENMCGNIPGSMTGESMGRIAGLMNFGSFYAIVYSVKKSSESTTDGIFLQKFTYENNAIKSVGSKITVKSNCASALMQIRAAKYGNRILITYIENSQNYTDAEYPSSYEKKTEPMYYMLIDTNGKILVNPLKVDSNQQAIAEDIRELRDGTLRWGYVDTKNILRIVKVDIEGKPDIPYESDDEPDDPDDPVNPKEDKGGLSGGAIAAIVIASVLVVGIVGCLLYRRFVKGIEWVDTFKLL